MYKSKFHRAKIICRSLKEGTGVYQACKAAGVSAMSFWRWRKDNLKFNAFVDRILESRTQHVIDSLYKKALEGNVTACIFWLKNKAGWKDVSEATIKGMDTKIIIVRDGDGTRGNTDKGQKGRLSGSLPI